MEVPGLLTYRFHFTVYRQQRWFVLNPSTATLLIFNHEVHLNVEDYDSQRKSTSHLPKAFPLDCARVSFPQGRRDTSVSVQASLTARLGV